MGSPEKVEIFNTPNLLLPLLVVADERHQLEDYTAWVRLVASQEFVSAYYQP